MGTRVISQRVTWSEELLANCRWQRHAHIKRLPWKLCFLPDEPARGATSDGQMLLTTKRWLMSGKSACGGPSTWQTVNVAKEKSGTQISSRHTDQFARVRIAT